MPAGASAYQVAVLIADGGSVGGIAGAGTLFT